MKTINDLRIYLRKRNNTSLDVKSSVWSAGFPVRNKAVPNEVFRAAGEAPRKPTDALAEFYSRLQNDDLSQTGMVDFIGPGIDVGFRLSSFASSKKLAVSLDCAYLLASTLDSILAFQEFYEDSEFNFFPNGTGGDGQKFEDRLRISFSGNEPLKGVLGGIHYPKFWINTLRVDSLDAAREKFYQGNRPHIIWKDLRIYCERFYKDRSAYINPPFINSRHSETLASMPEHYPEAYRRLIASLN